MEGITLLMLADDPWSDPILQFCKFGTGSRCVVPYIAPPVLL